MLVRVSKQQTQRQHGGRLLCHLREDGDFEGLASVGASQVDGQFGEEPPRCLPLQPAGQFSATPEP
jgi:hypothetical protein